MVKSKLYTCDSLLSIYSALNHLLLLLILLSIFFSSSLFSFQQQNGKRVFAKENQMFALKLMKTVSNGSINFKYIKLSSINRPNTMLLCTSCNNLVTTPVLIQSVYSEKYRNFLQPVKQQQLQFIQNAFYTGPRRKEFNIKLEKSKKLLTDTIETKRKNLQQKKENLMQEIREKKAKVQEKMEEYVERENVLTIPNLLCVARGILAPYLGYVIVHEHFTLAISLFAFAGITDLVIYCFFLCFDHWL